MADTTAIDQIPAKKSRNNSRKALKQKNPSPNETNIMSQEISAASPVSAKGKAKASKSKQSTSSGFEKELLEMQEMLEKLKIEKEKTEELLKEKDEILKAKEEEIEAKEKEQEKLQGELKKLQKLKEFKPTMSFPILAAEEDKKKKKGGTDKKKPLPPYILWCKDQWNEVKKENPEAEFKEISNILGAKWKNVTAEEKKPYEDKYKAERETYLQVMAKQKQESEAMKLLEEDHKQKTAMELLEQYLQFKQETEKENKKNKKEKDPLKPKQPLSAYLLFSNERRASLLKENKNILEVAKITGEEWKNLTEEQKAPYEEMAKKNKEIYLQEMETYKQRKEDEALNLKKEEEELMKLHKQEALQLLKKKEKTENLIKKTKEKRQKKKQQQQEPNRPKKPASSFILFSKEARKNLMQPGMNNSTINAMISLKWKELGQEEREMWNAKAAEAMEAYKKDLEEYNKLAATVKQEASTE